jgi:hypothetical protein
MEPKKSNKAGGTRARPQSRKPRSKPAKQTEGQRVGVALNKDRAAKAATVAKRRDIVAGLLDAGASTSQIEAALAEEFGYMTPQTTRNVARQYITEARKARVGEYRAAKMSNKAEQVARIRNDLIRMRSMGRVPWSSVAKAEELLARITGTLEPIGVNVSGSVAVHESLLAVIARLEPDDVEHLVAEQVAIEAAAASVGVTPQALPGDQRRAAHARMDDRSSMGDPIDTEGHPVDPDVN